MAFDTSENVVIGLTSDVFVSSAGKIIQNNFDQRKFNLEKYLADKFPGRSYEITRLESRFGPAIFTENIDAIIVSEETLPNVASANERRKELGFPELKVEVVPMVLAEDNNRISSTRIRSGEIDEEGKIKSK